ncbi:alginate lyase [Stenotrophomonas sp. ZAC14D1_NAIMI4_6]|nr:alginate lyase [Stenotrophomonas sp. ZAC14D1_NAIMI4_6]AWH43027.1 alginate lyase [Stenotrophomonas sp. ZAC14D1_NAIMI4_1]
MRTLFSLVLLLSLSLTTTASAAPWPYASFDPGHLDWTREQIAAGNEAVKPAYGDLLRRADRLLQRAPASVMDKRRVAASGDKHDFFAMAKYAWRDASKPESAAYATRDSERNPEAEDGDFDRKRYNDTVRSINVLALAYRLSGKREYAVKAGQLLKVWFINPDTRMNPNFRFAAMRPGANDGHFSGIIEGVVLVEMLDYVALLQDSGALSQSEETRLKSWFKELADWLIGSDFGRRESAQSNNHGSWYRAQVAAFSLYSGDDARAESQIKAARGLIRAQFAPDGSMPREMTRANSAMYSVYGLRSVIYLARLSGQSENSLWQEQANGKPLIKHALAYLAPYYSGQKNWSSGHVKTGVDPYVIQVFRLGATAYSTSEFDPAMSHIIAQLPPTDQRARLLGPPKAVPH